MLRWAALFCAVLQQCGAKRGREPKKKLQECAYEAFGPLAEHRMHTQKRGARGTMNCI